MNNRVAKYFQTGRVDNIGQTAIQVTASSVICRNGIAIYADSGNTGAIYVGGPGVTAFGASGTDGFPLRPLDRFNFDIDNASGLFMVSNQGTTNRVFWFAR